MGAGDTVGIVGPNGAGKTSLFGLISGDLAPGAGQVSFAGKNITRMDSAARCRLGIGRTYQVPRPFVDMTVFENVLVAAQQGAGLRRKASYAAAAAALERVGMAGEAKRAAGRLACSRASAWRSPVRSPPGRSCCCSTRSPAALPTPRSPSSWRSSAPSTTRNCGDHGWSTLTRALTSLVSRMTCLYGGEFIGDGTPAEVLRHPAGTRGLPRQRHGNPRRSRPCSKKNGR